MYIHIHHRTFQKGYTSHTFRTRSVLAPIILRERPAGTDARAHIIGSRVRRIISRPMMMMMVMGMMDKNRRCGQTWKGGKT